MSANAKRTQTWESTKLPNLFRLRETGTYYGRVKPKNGGQIRKSLETTSFAVAREKLRNWLLSLQAVKLSPSSTFGGVMESYFSWLEGQRIRGKIVANTIEYKKSLLDQISVTWSGFNLFRLEKLTDKTLREWQIVHRRKYSATRTNGATTVLREMIDVAVAENVLTREAADKALPGLRYVAVDYDYKRLTLNLPEPAKLMELRLEVYRRCKMRGTFGGWLFDFLLFSGCRIESANEALWEDVLWNANGIGKLYFRKAKYGPYEIPLFPQLRELLERIKAAKPGAPRDRILPTKSIQTVLTAACHSLGISHLSHHDLRHIFATRCIELGKDIPLVAYWLGHKDGGRTAMMVYGHIRQSHSAEQARNLDFLGESAMRES